MDNGRLKKRRLELELTLEQVGNLVGVTKSTVRKWETGAIENMKRDKIALLAKALKVEPAFIMGISEVNIENEPKEIKKYLSKFKEQLISLKKGGTLFVDFLCEDGRVIEIKTINKKPYIFIFNLNDNMEDKKISVFSIDMLFDSGRELEDCIYENFCFGKVIRCTEPLSYSKIVTLVSKNIISLVEKYFNNLDISLEEKEKTINKLQELFYKAKFNAEKDE